MSTYFQCGAFSVCIWSSGIHGLSITIFSQIKVHLSPLVYLKFSCQNYWHLLTSIYTFIGKDRSSIWPEKMLSPARKVNSPSICACKIEQNDDLASRIDIFMDHTGPVEYTAFHTDNSGMPQNAVRKIQNHCEKRQTADLRDGQPASFHWPQENMELMELR